MKTIFITSKLNFVDAGGSVTDLDLKAKGSTVITVYSNKNKINKRLPYNVIEKYFKTSHQIPVQYKIFKLMREYKPDVYHVEGQYMYGAGLYKMFNKTPVILFYNREFSTWHTPPGLRYLVEKYIGGLLIKKIDHYIFTNPFLRDKYYKYGLSKKVPHTIMPDFVKLPQGTRVEQDKIQIYCTGRMTSEKRFDLVLKEFAKLKNQNKYRLILGGDGVERTNLMELSVELGIKAEFPGWVNPEKKANYLVNTDIFILPEWKAELTSVILIEAMSLGLPCLVPKGGACAWLLDNAPNLLFDKYKPLSSIIAEMGNFKSLRELSGLHCKKQYDKFNKDLKKLLI